MKSTLEKRLKHSAFSQPENLDTKVWRYMDSSKFINLILTQKLYFSRIDLHKDIFEGSLTFPSYLFKQESIANSNLENEVSRYKKILDTFYINCWRIDNHESEAMWKTYCPQNDEIAIQTTYKKLVNSLNDDDDVYIGLVKYLDYDTEPMESLNHFFPIMHKRKAFEHEKEIRLVKASAQFWNLHSYENNETGIKIDWDFFKTIETVYVNPYSTQWYFETIKELLIKLNLSIEIKWSSMKNQPYY